MAGSGLKASVMAPRLTAVLLTGLSCLATGGGEPGKPAGVPQLPPHHGAKGFRNPHLAEPGRLRDFCRWRLGWGPQEQPALPATGVPPPCILQSWTPLSPESCNPECRSQ
jgi:hypothetical protein